MVAQEKQAHVVHPSWDDNVPTIRLAIRCNHYMHLISLTVKIAIMGLIHVRSSCLPNYHLPISLPVYFILSCTLYMYGVYVYIYIHHKTIYIWIDYEGTATLLELSG